ncbi:MAG: hypothetical protein NUV76_00125 [Candidatus Kuenenia sp.]|nr:hypothetical protein [Candidatus Kuenenia sp.]
MLYRGIACSPSEFVACQASAIHNIKEVFDLIPEIKKPVITVVLKEELVNAL